MDKHYRELIAKEFKNCVEGTITRIFSNEQTYRPFHTALLSEDVIFWSGFERSFSTSFGQRVIEEIAKLVALSNGATEANRQKVTFVDIDTAYNDAISKHIQCLRDNTATARDWASTIKEIKSVKPSGKMRQLRIISDLWWKKDGIDNYISLKTVKPNIDQTAVAKEDCLHMTISNPNCKAYFGLPYNPYGENKADYAFNPPMGIFDFHSDPVVLIGKEMWDTIGGKNCYEELLDIAKEVGAETKSRIENLRK